LAGEELGFLPGTEKSKLEPLLAPALDAITKVMGPKAWDALHKAGLLDFQSFAYMRGRTHDHAFVVAEEIQNASFVQLKMLATRVGANSKLCILGDPTQFDRRDNWANSPLNLFAKAVTEKQQVQSAWQIDADPAADHAQALGRMQSNAIKCNQMQSNAIRPLRGDRLSSERDGAGSSASLRDARADSPGTRGP